MGEENDIITYDVLELDIYGLKKKILERGIKEAVVYGIGNNGKHTYRLFKNIGIKIQYFIDVKALQGINSFRNHEVISPDEFLVRYQGEYVVITPSIHVSISEWMKKNGVSEDRLIEAFYQTEKISIDYGKRFERISNGLSFCEEKPKTVEATFVTIAYNTPENLLRRAIESVLKQTVKELKYLFILNGPTDNTAKIINEYAKRDGRICVVNLEKNLSWTNPELLKAIRDNLEGEYCCQLDSDDYYAEDFLQETLNVGQSNRADIVCTRTCLFSADSTFDPLNDGLAYDWHDKFYFNMVHPYCHIIGHHPIMVRYAKSEICSTFWGKLYANTLMRCYLDYLIALPEKERELYYRLDIAMTYRILSMAERVFYTDKVLHFSQYSRKNSTFTLAPVEWLMSLWYAYTGIKKELYEDMENKKARKYSKLFLKVHIMWMVGRKGMLKNDETWKYREEIITHFNEMLDDPVFKIVLMDKRNYMLKDCKEFYETIKRLAGREECYDI